MTETFEIKDKRGRVTITMAVREGEWFIHPSPVNLLIPFCHGMRMLRLGKEGRKKERVLISWSDIKRDASDCLRDDVIEAVDGIIAKCERERARDPLSGEGDQRLNVHIPSFRT